MGTDQWRARLADAIAAKGISMRAVSISAGLGAGYVHSVLKDGKDPSVDNLISVCRVLGVSLLKILYGIEASPATERVILLLESDPAKRDGLLLLLGDQG